LHSTPTYASWLSLVERWFAELTYRWLRRGTHRSVRENCRRDPQLDPTVERGPETIRLAQDRRQILDNLAHYCQRISDSGH
jgi:hypothetical protein